MKTDANMAQVQGIRCGTDTRPATQNSVAGKWVWKWFLQASCDSSGVCGCVWLSSWVVDRKEMQIHKLSLKSFFKK